MLALTSKHIGSLAWTRCWVPRQDLSTAASRGGPSSVFEGEGERLEVKEVQSRESYTSWKEGGQRGPQAPQAGWAVSVLQRERGIAWRDRRGLSSASVLGASRGQVRRRTGEVSSQKS